MGVSLEAWHHMELDELMRGFAAKHGIPGVQSAGDGQYRLVFDDIPVVFSAPGADLVMSAWLAEKPAEGGERLAELLLAANRRFAATDGSALAFDADRSVYLLERRERLDALDVDAFSALVEAYVNKAEEFREMIRAYAPAAQSADEAQAAERAAFGAFGANGLMQV